MTSLYRGKIILSVDQVLADVSMTEDAHANISRFMHACLRNSYRSDWMRLDGVIQWDVIRRDNGRR